MNHVMLDLETLGNGTNACIIQIGACYFDDVTGEIGKTFKVNVDARDAVRKGAVLDADTVYWWLSQSKEAQISVTSGDKYSTNQGDHLHQLEVAMQLLYGFINPCPNVWSHATFDFVIYQHTMKMLGLGPINYRASRDIRSLMALAEVNTKDFAREGTHHDALDDCIFQVKYVVAALNKLRGQSAVR